MAIPLLRMLDGLSFCASTLWELQEMRYSAILDDLGFAVDAVSYDYSFTYECLEEPHRPQYGGGIVTNAELNQGLKGWEPFGQSKVEARRSKSGNAYIVARQRRQRHDSFSQKIYLEKDLLYTFSGTYFPKLSNDTAVDILADSISLQPFTQEEWRSHQDHSIEKARKSKVKLQAVDAQGNALANAAVSIVQKNSDFPIGVAINKNILSNTAYQNWFTSRFKVTAFEDEMKWYSTEYSQGREDYSVPDAMLQLTKSNGISVRGHNVFWDDPQRQPKWVQSLSTDEIRTAAEARINSMMTRYSGQLIAWDVVNENIHHSFFESELGEKASIDFYHQANNLDGNNSLLFLNEYNTLEIESDGASSPAKYLAKINDIQSAGQLPLAIGLQGHFYTPNLAYMRSAIDQLAAAKLPIWLTELDVSNSPDLQARYLDQIIREAHGHPAVNGIVIWSAWHPTGCYQMCLTDNDFRNLPTGDVVDNIIKEFSFNKLSGTTDANGYLEASLFHGEYEVTVSHPKMGDSSVLQSFKVASTGFSEQTLNVKVFA
ncbi:hypothetical protein RJ640_018636 [Escallonia rubra]|uniref:GH10 domain-containing protein n=1 Tax=Escallonia rubra TaxID=112253 RepID=A0AA88R8L9_9ASTE|nr:hypothetical protein RJ640_018636 [Escallonia rubra]